MSSAFRLLNVPIGNRAPGDLFEMLQCAIKLEHTTLPPYLTAMWSIVDESNPAYEILETVVYEEMGHMGTVCNLLNAVGGPSPLIHDKDFVPHYPTKLPCDIAPSVICPNLIDWKISLSRLTPTLVSDIFMIIEYPEGGPAQVTEMAPRGTTPAEGAPKYCTIGEFYDAIRETLIYLVGQNKIKICPDQKQITALFAGHDENGQNVVKPINSLEDAILSIEHIKEQGEGTTGTEDAPTFGCELAHYYRFKQIQVGQLYEQTDSRSWVLSGALFDFPAVRPMADIPADGYDPATVPKEAAMPIKNFNDNYKQMLALLQLAWEKGGKGGGQKDLGHATSYMNKLKADAVSLMSIPIDPKHPEKGCYGPTFRPF
jgi:Ferritin-like